MARASIISYQLTRPGHRITMSKDRNNFFKVDLKTKMITEQDGILYQPKQDTRYLGWMMPVDIIREIRLLSQEWYWIKFTKISQKRWQELMAEDGN